MLNNKTMLKNFNKVLHRTSISTIYKHNNLVLKKTRNINGVSNKETNILRFLDHPNIPRVIFSQKTFNNQYLVMDYYPYGDLYDNCEKKNIDTNDYNTFISKLIKPIYYIHKNNVVHLDIKLENYLLTHNNEFMLIDFQVSDYHNNLYNHLDSLKYVVGSNHYVAPEVKELAFCKSSDIYSLGCILHMIYADRFYDGKIDYNLLKKCDNKLVNIIENTLQENHLHRPNIYDLTYFYNLK